MASMTGERIRAIRVSLGYKNQTEFAKALRVTQGTVSDWERGTTQPSRGMIRLVADLCAESDKVFTWLETGRDHPGFLRRRKAS